jgi:hypothetical protein
MSFSLAQAFTPGQPANPIGAIQVRTWRGSGSTLTTAARGLTTAARGYRAAASTPRLDRFNSAATPQEAITVTKIVSSLDSAKSEVARLNTLNGPKGATYFWQTTRMQLGDTEPDAK